MATSKETALQKRIQEAVKRKYKSKAWKVKYHGDETARGGVPDLLFCIKGLFIAIEVKLPGKKPDKLQKEEIADIILAGGEATYCTTVPEALQFIRKVLKSRGRFKKNI